jgi:23S rRNA (cytidine1920-2'-O)/16S rRNA (cytidine1409-2'-O)-methyltransferase
VDKIRLDQELVNRNLVASRSQAESHIKLGLVTVNGVVVIKPALSVSDTDKVVLNLADQYVSRAGLKLASVANSLRLDFKDKIVLDVGSSTGGFTDYALRHGAKKVIAVEVGSNQMHPKLRTDSRIELYEKTDIRNVWLSQNEHKAINNNQRVQIVTPDIILIDVSFISLRQILPHISKLMSQNSILIAMLKPQFEAQNSGLKHKGVIKNDAMRRDILKDFETWTQKLFAITDKADSEVAGAKGNRERFYLLRTLKKT